MIDGNTSREILPLLRTFSRIHDQIDTSHKRPFTQTVDVAQNVVAHRPCVFNQPQVGLHPLNSILAVGIRRYVAAGVLLDLIPHLEDV